MREAIVSERGNILREATRIWIAFLAALLIVGPAPAAEPDAATTAAINALEQSRIQALNAQDAQALQRVLSPNYLHVHTTGRVDDRAAYVKDAVSSGRKTTRGPLSIRVYGDSAVVLGPAQVQLPNPPPNAPADVAMQVTQVAHREAGGWRLVLSSASRAGGTMPAPSTARPTYPPGPTLSRAEAEVAALEARRGEALAKGDVAALEPLLDSDYKHIAPNGSITERADYIASIKAPRPATRGPLTVRVYGDTAVIVGPSMVLVQAAGQPDRVVDTVYTQVARRVDGRWKFLLTQITGRTGQ